MVPNWYRWTKTELRNNLNHYNIIQSRYLSTCMQVFILECNTRQHGILVNNAQQWAYTYYFKIMQTIFICHKKLDRRSIVSLHRSSYYRFIRSECSDTIWQVKLLFFLNSFKILGNLGSILLPHHYLISKHIPKLKSVFKPRMHEYLATRAYKTEGC